MSSHKNMWPYYLCWEHRRNGDPVMSTIRRGQNMKHALLKAYFLLAHCLSLFQILGLYLDQEFSIGMNLRHGEITPLSS